MTPCKATFPEQLNHKKLDLQFEVDFQDLKYGKRLILGANAPLQLKVSELQFPFEEFKEKTGKSTVHDNIDLYPSIELWLESDIQEKRPKALVAGAGIAGLMTSHHLIQKGLDVTMKRAPIQVER